MFAQLQLDHLTTGIKIGKIRKHRSKTKLEKVSIQLVDKVLYKMPSVLRSQLARALE